MRRVSENATRNARCAGVSARSSRNSPSNSVEYPTGSVCEESLDVFKPEASHRALEPERDALQHVEVRDLAAVLLAALGNRDAPADQRGHLAPGSGEFRGVGEGFVVALVEIREEALQDVAPVVGAARLDE